MEGLKSNKDRGEREDTSSMKCAYSIPLWQCFLRNWKTFLTTFSTSLKGCWIWGWTRGVKWTTPTSTCRHTERERDLITRLQSAHGNGEWQEGAGRCEEERGECKMWWGNKNAREKGCLTNGKRDTKLDKEREGEVAGSIHWDKREEEKQKIRWRSMAGWRAGSSCHSNTCAMDHRNWASLSFFPVSPRAAASPLSFSVYKPDSVSLHATVYLARPFPLRGKPVERKHIWISSGGYVGQPQSSCPQWTQGLWLILEKSLIEVVEKFQTSTQLQSFHIPPVSLIGNHWTTVKTQWLEVLHTFKESTEIT